MNPPLGTFIRPEREGWLFAYALRVDKIVHDDDDEDQWQCTNFRLDPHTGYRGAAPEARRHYLRGLALVEPGLWRDTRELHWSHTPRFWRAIPAGPQQDLFA